MNKPLAYVKVQGTQATIYIDPASNQIQALHDADEEPVGGFPYTCPRRELHESVLKDCGIDLRGYEIKEVIKVRPPNPVGAPVSGPEADEIAREMGVSKFLADEKRGIRHPGPGPLAQIPLTPAAVSEWFPRENILAAFRDLDESEVEAVGSFLINIEPGLEADLLKARLPQAPTEKKRFKVTG